MLMSNHSPFVSIALKAIGRVFGFDRGYLATLVICCGVLAAAFGSTLTEASSEPPPHLRTGSGTGIQKAANLALLTRGVGGTAPGNGIAAFFPNLAASFPMQLAATNDWWRRTSTTSAKRPTRRSTPFSTAAAGWPRPTSKPPASPPFP